MSEEKRRSARTQSRFGGDKDPSSRREKEKQKSQKRGSRAGEKTKNESSMSKMAAEGVSVEYQDNSNYSFKEIEKKKKPGKLSFQGLHELSTTENGISRLIYDKEFILQQQSEELISVLIDTTKWHDKNIVIRGEEYPQPRLVAWYGPFPYTYSGATLEAAEMPQTILDIKQRVETFLKGNGLNVVLNSVLLNFYRNEKDSVAWHSDDELTMGVSPTIASVSLGSVRRFEMRPKFHTVQQNENLDEETVFSVDLEPGSLIIMDGCMQDDWQHRVPKEYHDRQPRINLTFRTVYPIDQVSSNLTDFKVKNFNKPSGIKCPEEARFDVDSFPPLGPTNHKNKTFTNSKDSRDTVSSNDNISANGHEINSLEHAVDENENQNNLNKDLDCSTLEDSSHYNVMEPEKSSDKFTASNDYENHVSGKLYPENDSSSIGLEDDAQKFTPAVENGKRQKSQSKSAANRHRFNINAPDFVPKNINIAGSPEVASEPTYARFNLRQLAQHYETIGDLSPEELLKFSETVFERIDDSNQGIFFTGRDHHELRTLHALNVGGQSQSNRIIILDRIFSIIQKCEYESQRDYDNRRNYRSPNRYHGNRNGYSGDNYRSRNFTRTNFRH